MKLVYFSSPSLDQLAGRTAAYREAIEIVDRGAALPIVGCSLRSSMLAHGTADFWVRSDIALMLRCHAVLVLGKWQESPRTLAEVRAADVAKLPVFYDTAELFRWLSGAAVGTLDGQRGTLEELLAGLPQTLRLRCSEQVREIREWRKDADDGLLYQAHTVGKIRLSSRGDVLFEQVEDATPEVSFDEAETQPRFAGAFPPNAVTRGIDMGQFFVVQGAEKIIPLRDGLPLFDFKEPLTLPPSPNLADLESALAQIPAAPQLPDFVIQSLPASPPQVTVKGGCRGCGSTEPLDPGAGLEQYVCKKCGDTYHLPVGAVPPPEYAVGDQNGWRPAAAAEIAELKLVRITRPAWSEPLG